MKKLLFFFIFFAFFLTTPLITPVFAAGEFAGAGVGANINYTGLWRGPDGKRPGIDAGTVPDSKLCTPKGYQFKLLCGPATASFEAMNAAYHIYATAYNQGKGPGERISINLPVGGGYRTKASQLNGGGTFAIYNSNYAPPAHLWGTAIDFGFSDRTLARTDPEHKWLVANGQKFGWFWPNWAKNGQGGKGGYIEDWHFNYYFIGHNPANDNLESPFTGTSPGGVSTGGTSTAMACAVTNVGNAPGSPVIPAGCEDTSASGANGVIHKAANDFKAALDKCSGGSTMKADQSDDCTDKELKAKGYKKNQIDAFYARRAGALSSDPVGLQCLGYVSVSIALATGSSTGFGLAGANEVGGKTELRFGDNVFKKVDKPQPGDVGFTTSDRNSFGHTLIVDKLKGNTGFIGIEANWTPYKVTNNEVHPNNKYKFFRLQPKT